uniref:Major facilitator superfamily (MFS) profile domain-containing protein n=1 Tax=Skeletonema marinoi TaxID=267567 RepID=A0A7S2KW68_9STRA|mmetsp:Transcript_17718/g.29959  ORF Transcript_17718/g.29959 Transcript_17718/m.29959 type:complete len:630 (+) Transcript_17718:86-1975(+)
MMSSPLDDVMYPSDSSTDSKQAKKSYLRLPTFYNEQGTTRPFYLFPLFLLINIITMADRAIIPGASQEFLAFLGGASDSPAVVKNNPDAGLGILQAAFMIGYTLAIILSGHYVHKIKWKPLVFFGLCVWWLGVLGSGNAKQYNSFYVLLFSRMATGCSEAAFQVVAPPLIQDRAGKRAGFWLSIFLMGLPLGLSVGYIYGSHMATSELWGWDWAYYWMCIGSFPLLVVFAFVRDVTNGGVLSGEVVDVELEGVGSVTAVIIDGERDEVDEEDERERSTSLTTATTLEPLLPPLDNNSNSAVDATSKHHHNNSSAADKKDKFTILSEVKTCLNSKILVTLSLGQAAIFGVVTALGTFGGAFILALQLFDDEKVAATWFGITAALAGVIGTPLGGSLVDKILARYGAGDNDNDGGASSSGLRGEGIDDSLRHPIIASILPRMNALVAAAMLFIFPTLAMQDAAFFLFFLFVGWTLLFATQTGISICAMLSVKNAHRPNALAFISIAGHLLGDVPLPIILGLIKDRLAPGCKVGEDGSFSKPEECASQEKGVRATLAIAYVWVLWALVFFELARRLSRIEIGKRRSDEINSLLLQEEDSNGASANGEKNNSSFRYYHSKFQPTPQQSGRSLA